MKVRYTREELLGLAPTGPVDPPPSLLEHAHRAVRARHVHGPPPGFEARPPPHAPPGFEARELAPEPVHADGPEEESDPASWRRGDVVDGGPVHRHQPHHQAQSQPQHQHQQPQQEQEGEEGEGQQQPQARPPASSPQHAQVGEGAPNEGHSKRRRRRKDDDSQPSKPPARPPAGRDDGGRVADAAPMLRSTERAHAVMGDVVKAVGDLSRLVEEGRRGALALVAQREELEADNARLRDELAVVRATLAALLQAVPKEGLAPSPPHN